jgi:hypothetical protein
MANAGLATIDAPPRELDFGGVEMFGGTMRRFGLALASAASVAALAAVMPAHAADLNGGAYADLEERIAELEATTARKGTRKVKLEISGFVNEALFAWDDGKERNAYVVTNESAPDRFRFKGDAKITDTWSAGYLLEIGVRGARQDRSNQDAPNSVNALDLRHSAWWLSNKSLGKFWVGQTSDAADGITEVNLANTNHFASASVPQSWGDGGSGFFIRRSDGVLSTINWGDLVVPGQSGIPGEGHRQNLVKYETPVIAGFTGSASWGEDDVWNIALRYVGDAAGFKIAGGIAYTSWSDGALRRGTVLANNDPDLDVTEVGLSASILHTATGLYATGAYGQLEDNNKDKLYGFATDDTTDFFFIQAGIEKKFLPIGKTTVFGEYWQLDGGTAINASNGGKLDVSSLGAGQYIKNSELKVWGLGLNQNLSEVIDVYVAYRHVEADINTVSSTGVAAGKASVDDFQYVTTGAYIKF